MKNITYIRLNHAIETYEDSIAWHSYVILEIIIGIVVVSVSVFFFILFIITFILLGKTGDIVYMHMVLK